MHHEAWSPKAGKFISVRACRINLRDVSLLAERWECNGVDLILWGVQYLPGSNCYLRIIRCESANEQWVCL